MTTNGTPGNAEMRARVVIRRAGLALLVLGVLLCLTAIAATFAAIWTHGTDLPTRFAGTAFVAGFLGFIVGGSGWVLYAD